MSYFVWGPDLVIDDGPIDADHRRLVEQVNTLHTATSQGLGQTVVAVLLEDLIASTQEHLQREEALMRSTGFAQMARHQRGHDAFMTQLRALQARHAGGSVTVATQLSALLRDWLSLHIRRSDKELAAMLTASAGGG